MLGTKYQHNYHKEFREESSKAIKIKKKKEKTAQVNELKVIVSGYRVTKMRHQN